MCPNVLHSNLNLFDSLNLTPPEDSERMLKNLVRLYFSVIFSRFYFLLFVVSLISFLLLFFQSANFSTTCMDANLFPPWFSQFPCKALSKYPQEHDMYVCFVHFLFI